MPPGKDTGKDTVVDGPMGMTWEGFLVDRPQVCGLDLDLRLPV